MKKVTVLLGVMLMILSVGCDYDPNRPSNNLIKITNNIEGTILEPHVNGGVCRERGVPGDVTVRIPCPGEYMLDLGDGATGAQIDIEVWVYDAATGKTYYGNSHYPDQSPFPYEPWQYNTGYNNSYHYPTVYDRHGYLSWDVRTFDPPVSLKN